MNGYTPEELRAPAEAVLRLCREAGLRIATAESCTGGLLGATLTEVPGSSAVYEGGIVSYQNRVKAALLGVSEATLASVGAVSEACARQMAEGAAKVFKADLAMSTTGIAGPDGATAEKPVGRVYVAVTLQGETQVSENTFAGSRAEVRQQTVMKALEMAQQCLRK